MLDNKKPFINIPPGEFLREELESRKLSVFKMAEITGMNPELINRLINNKQAITQETSEVLGRAFNQSSEYWLNLETNYRSRLNERNSNPK